MLIRRAASVATPLLLVVLASLAGGAVAAFIASPASRFPSRAAWSTPEPVVNRALKGDRRPPRAEPSQIPSPMLSPVSPQE